LKLTPLAIYSNAKRELIIFILIDFTQKYFAVKHCHYVIGIQLAIHLPHHR